MSKTRIGRRAGVIATSLVFVASGLVATAMPASAAVWCRDYQYLKGSGGHEGGSIVCDGGTTGTFKAVAVCRVPGGQKYTHYGNRTFTNTKSTVWCDLNSEITWLGGTD
jgi:hypothetical protein